MIKIKSDQEKQLSFDLEISGSANVPEVRLVMETDNENGMKLVFPAIVEHGTAKVVIPMLKPILEAFQGSNTALKLETILDGVHSVIWEEPHRSLVADDRSVMGEVRKRYLQGGELRQRDVDLGAVEG